METKKIERVSYDEVYVAVDGTEFNDREECKKYGRHDKDGNPVAAVTAHHIQHLEDRPDLAYDVRNGQALCNACHNKAHPEKPKHW